MCAGSSERFERSPACEAADAIHGLRPLLRSDLSSGD
jgi:hypothetical protein